MNVDFLSRRTDVNVKPAVQLVQSSGQSLRLMKYLVEKLKLRVPRERK